MKMLNVITAAIFSIVLISCNSVSTDNTIHGQKVEQSGWKPDSVISKPVAVYDTAVMVSPTWSQSFDYASKRADHTVKVIAGIVFLLLFFGLFYGKATEASWFPKTLQNVLLFNATLFITLVAAVVLLTGDASGVKWNNDKWVKKEVYDKAISETGSTKPIWDSLENNCLIVDGPYNCYQEK